MQVGIKRKPFETICVAIVLHFGLIIHVHVHVVDSSHDRNQILHIYYFRVYVYTGIGAFKNYVTLFFTTMDPSPTHPMLM